MAKNEGSSRLEGFPFPNPLAGAAERMFDEKAFAEAFSAGLGVAAAKLMDGKKLKVTMTFEVVSE